MTLIEIFLCSYLSLAGGFDYTSFLHGVGKGFTFPLPRRAGSCGVREWLHELLCFFFIL